MNTKIYKVTTCKFIDMRKLDGVCRLEIDKYIERYCVLSADSSKAIDILTNEQFHILFKTEDNKIASFEKINLGQEYATYVQILDLDTLSKKQLSQLRCAYLKFMVVNNFPKIQTNQKQKVIKR